MNAHSILLAAIVATTVAAQVAAQQNIAVQLPTFHVTTARTTVSVPDGGSALLGGVSRAREGAVSRGVPLLGKLPGAGRPFKNRAIGRDVDVSQMSVTARIIDLEEEELRQTGVSAQTLMQTREATNLAGASTALAPPPSRRDISSRALAGVTAARAGINSAVADRADFIARHIGRRPMDAADDNAIPRDMVDPHDGARNVAPILASVAEVQQQNEAARQQRLSEAHEFYAKGRQAESVGKVGVAKIWYQMAARRAEGELLHDVSRRLTALEGSAANNQDRLAGR